MEPDDSPPEQTSVILRIPLIPFEYTITISTRKSLTVKGILEEAASQGKLSYTEEDGLMKDLRVLGTPMVDSLAASGSEFQFGAHGSVEGERTKYVWDLRLADQDGIDRTPVTVQLEKCYIEAGWTITWSPVLVCTGPSIAPALFPRLPSILHGGGAALEFRVMGIFTETHTHQLFLVDSLEVSLADVMEMATEQLGLKYRVDVEGFVASFAIQHSRSSLSSLPGAGYDPGVYELTAGKMSNGPHLSWQYSVRDDCGRPLPASVDQRSISKCTEKLGPNWSVTWRCVVTGISDTSDATPKKAFDPPPRSKTKASTTPSTGTAAKNGGFDDLDSDSDFSEWHEIDDPTTALWTFFGSLDEASAASMLGEVQSTDLTPEDFTTELGLLQRIAPLLMDRLARSQSFDKVLGSLAEGSPQDLTPKVLLTVLMAKSPIMTTFRQSAWAQAIYPLPLVKRIPPTHQEESSHLLIDPLPLLYILDGSFMASIPLGGARGASSLLNRLFRRNFEESPTETGPLHAGSVDVSTRKAGQEPFHILDFHAGDSSQMILDRAGARDAVQTTLGFAQYYLIHVRFDKDLIEAELIPFLRSLIRSQKFATMRKRVVVAFRDVCVDGKKFSKAVELIQQMLSSGLDMKGGMADAEWLELVFLKNISSLDSITRDRLLNPIYNKLVHHFVGAVGYQDFWELRSAMEECKAAVPSPSILSSLPPEDSNKFHEAFASAKAAISAVDAWPAALMWSKMPYQLSVNDGTSMTEVYKQRQHLTLNPVVGHFVNAIKDDVANLTQWKQQLVLVADGFKDISSDLNAKCAKVVSDIEQLDREIGEIVKKTGAPSAEKKAERDALQKDAQKLRQQADGYTITVEKLWREALELYDCWDMVSEPSIKLAQFKPADLASAFKECMMRGFAMELLDGDNLVVHREFVEDVFARLAGGSDRDGLRTVAILGPQSSGKSTLANALFGGDFATSAGRCTKGLYASLFKTKFPGLGKVLFLDTEGLCSVEKDQEFDQKLALLTISMSDVILVNVRGEMDNRVANVLQMAVYCLKEMNILAEQRKPELIFVQRDMVDFSVDKQRTTMLAVENQMREATKLLFNPDGSQVQLNDVLKFDESSLVLMPSAFSCKESVMDQHKSWMVPNPAFGEECFQLRKKIVDKALSQPSNVKDLPAWGSRFCTIKTTIDKYGKLTNFHDVHALQIRQRFDENIVTLLNVYVYGRTDDDSSDKSLHPSSLDASFACKEEDIRTRIQQMLKAGSHVDREATLLEIKRDFESFAELQVRAFIGEEGTLWRAYMDMCNSVSDISQALRDDGLRTLHGRVSLFVDSRLSAFAMSYRRHKTNHIVESTIMTLKSELKDMQREKECLTEESAKAFFEQKWEEASRLLDQEIKKNSIDYRALARRTFEGFIHTHVGKALSLDAIMAAKPDSGLRWIVFPDEMPDHAVTEPVLYPACASHIHWHTASQFDLCINLYDKAKSLQRGLGNGSEHFLFQETPFQKSAFTIWKPAGHCAKWCGTVDGVHMEAWLATDCRGVQTGELKAVEINSGKRSLFTRPKKKAVPEIKWKTVRITPWNYGTKERRVLTFKAGLVSREFYAEQIQLNESALSGMCAFFDIHEDAVDDAILASGFLSNWSWLWSTIGCAGGSAALDEIEDEIKRRKSELIHSVYLKLADVIREYVSMVDASMGNLSICANQLFKRLSKIAQDKPHLNPTWELTANMKNECLRTFHRWVVSEAESKRNEANQALFSKFEGEKNILKDNFVLRVTAMRSDSNSANSFLRDLWHELVFRSRIEHSSKVAETITGMYKTTEEFMKKCDDHFVANHEHRTDDDIFCYLTHPVAAMSSYLDVQWAAAVEKSVAKVREAWHFELMDKRQELYLALKDLQKIMRTVGRDENVAHPLSGSGPDEHVLFASLSLGHSVASDAEATSKVFYQFITCGKAVLYLDDGRELVLSTDHVVDLLSVEVTLDEQIIDMEAFVNAMIVLIETTFNEAFIQSQELDEALWQADKRLAKEQWIGCTACCPYCRKKCTNQKHDVSEGGLIKHTCSIHQPLGFGGVKVKETSKPVFILCDSASNRNRYYADSNGLRRPFEEHLKHEHPEWSIAMNSDGSAHFVVLQAKYQQIWEREPQADVDGCEKSVRQLLCDHHAMLEIDYAEGQAAAAEACTNKLQLVVLCDTTSSMGGELSQCKSDIKKLAECVKADMLKSYADAQLEFGFIGYKDKRPTGGVDPGHLERVNLTTDLDAVQRKVQMQNAAGGGDPPEDILGAFRVMTSEFSWNRDPSVRKVCVLICDAPCHGPQYAGGMSDDFPGDGALMPAALDALVDMNISLLISSINKHTETMEMKFQEHYRNCHDRIQEGVVCKTFDLRRESGSETVVQSVTKALQTLVESDK